jgi:hypothetical protein
LIQRNALLAAGVSVSHQPMEDSMTTLDIVMALIAVTIMFATVAIVLGWDQKTNKG